MLQCSIIIPQSKIKDFCQPPLGKGAEGAVCFIGEILAPLVIPSRSQTGVGISRYQ